MKMIKNFYYISAKSIYICAYLFTKYFILSKNYKNKFPLFHEIKTASYIDKKKCHK